MKNKIKLPLKAKHFINATYIDNCNCAISKAAKEFFNTDSAAEGVNELIINKTDHYSHEEYGPIEFMNDKSLAKKSEDQEAIIRTIELHKKN